MTTANRIYSIAGSNHFEAQSCVKGIFVNPKLPYLFDDTANDSRPFEHMLWWGRPYIIGDEEKGWTVRCLDGGAWDRSTFLGDYNTLDDAVAAAHHALLHPKIYQATPLGESGNAFGMAPVEWTD